VDVTNNNTIIAYLLALRDFSDSLSDREKESLKTIAKALNIQPKAWKSDIEPDLIQTIAGNPQLNQYYQSYKEKLNRLGSIPIDLLPDSTELDRFKPNGFSFATKGFFGTEPVGYEQQLNNVVIVVNQTDKPEETVKQLGFLDKVRQLLETSQ
jgi:hypothetical protein